MLQATIAAVGTALPEHRVPQADVKEAVRHMFSASVPHLDRLLMIFDHGGIDARHFCMPLEWFLLPHSIEEKHRLFVEHAAALSERAALTCLDRAGVAPDEIDHVFFVTTTGTATPSIDAHLCNRLGFNADVKRSPIWGLGCAGGAAGLSRAAEYVTAFPKHRALLVSVELCSLTFLRDDASKSGLVATSLFADGAAAALVEGAGAPARGTAGRPAPRIVSTQSRIWPGSLDVMGWEVTNDGLKVVFSKDIPSIVTREMRDVVEELLVREGVRLPDIAHYVLHPGGMKVLRAYEEALGIAPGRLAAAERVLRRNGNMSSCTVLFVLEATMAATGAPRSGELGIAGALGPGFSSELLLLRF